eukprot:TRINITY_DN9740_c0_g1_i1.p1 TRINITY_DN9740_c0_g1~~TRINITY_DN9740_c0_g1_i1.p1  ORF type:complete len:114 (+),score=21.61 TRINITY_DN9740_c0_g1_i1:86-427(+)
MEANRLVKPRGHQTGENVYNFMSREAELREARRAVEENNRIMAVSKWAQSSEAKVQRAKLLREAKSRAAELRDLSKELKARRTARLRELYDRETLELQAELHSRGLAFATHNV